MIKEIAEEFDKQNRINDVIIRKVGSNIEITNMKVNKSTIEDFL